jgi:hypothetical protein
MFTPDQPFVTAITKGRLERKARVMVRHEHNEDGSREIVHPAIPTASTRVASFGPELLETLLPA